LFYVLVAKVNIMGALRTILPLAVTAGINLYLTVLMVGLSIRFGWVDEYPAGLQALATLPMLIGAGVLYIVEFLADKIAFVDNIWDVIHTFLRPVGAALIASASLAGLDPDLVDAAAGLTGVSAETGFFAVFTAGAVALISHGGKASTRAAVNVSSPVESFSNILISLAEDVLVAIVAFLALQFPVIANILSLAILGLIIVFVPVLLRWLWFIFGAMFAWLRSFVRPIRRSEQLPKDQAALLNEAAPELTVHCQAQNLAGARGRYGYLNLLREELIFTYRAWFRPQRHELLLEHIDAPRSRNKLFMRVLEFDYTGAEKPLVLRFVSPRDRYQLIEEMIARLQRSTDVQK